MKSAEITSLCGAEVQKPQTANIQATEVKATAVEAANIEDPDIVKIAKLALILADKATDAETKGCCIQVGIRLGFITKEEAAQLSMFTADLEQYAEDLRSALDEE